ncbi:MAG: 4Fe-4S dicluster domain-containing protein [Proteobacteria bacterium]|nr:4Fe-4S dicluster domain-containing protein [Pseudomonadota bacterium]
MDQVKEIFLRKNRCMGCHSCELACAVAHSASKNMYEAMGEVPLPKNRVYVEAVSENLPIPVLCRHCEDAPCMHACIAGAIRRMEDHSLFTDADKCIGCWTCVMVCPYGVIGRHLDAQKAYRCDRCPDLEEPACVSACPTKALVYQSVTTFSKDKRRHAAEELSRGEGK